MRTKYSARPRALGQAQWSEAEPENLVPDRGIRAVGAERRFQPRPRYGWTPWSGSHRPSGGGADW